jgi:hypothetical protein
VHLCVFGDLFCALVYMCESLLIACWIIILGKVLCAGVCVCVMCVFTYAYMFDVCYVCVHVCAHV